MCGKRKRRRQGRERTACENTRPWPKLQGGTTEGHGSLGAEEEVEGPRDGGGVGWLEVEDRAEVQGLTGGTQLEEGGVVQALLGTLLGG